MKIHEEITVKKTEKNLSDIICNICGEKIHKNEFGYFNDYATIEKSWGYGSPFDGEKHCIDICEKCYYDLFLKLKIKPVCEQ